MIALRDPVELCVRQAVAHLLRYVRGHKDIVCGRDHHGRDAHAWQQVSGRMGLGRLQERGIVLGAQLAKMAHIGLKIRRRLRGDAQEAADGRGEIGLTDAVEQPAELARIKHGAEVKKIEPHAALWGVEEGLEGPTGRAQEGRDGGKAARRLGIEFQQDLEAGAVADANRALQLEMLDDGTSIGNKVGEGCAPGIGSWCGFAVTTIIPADDLIVERILCGKMAPKNGGTGEAITTQDRSSTADHLEVDAGTVGTGHEAIVGAHAGACRGNWEGSQIAARAVILQDAACG